MEDGSCLFEPTKFKPFPPPYVYTVTGRLSSKEPNISTLPRSRPSSFFDKIRNLFR
jgi:hypothetical protein